MSARMTTTLVILAAAVGCGRIGFDVQADGGLENAPTDASPDDAGPPMVDIAEPSGR